MAEENPYAPPETVVNDDIRNIAVRSIPHRGNYASRWARLGGALIDVVVLVIAALAVDYLGDRSVGSFDEWAESESEWGDSLIAGFISFLTYATIQSYTWHYRGQSIGKLVLGMRIVTLDGRQASWALIFFIREPFAHVIGHISSLLSVIDPLLIFRSEHNCLHDDVARTRVISIAKAVASENSSEEQLQAVRPFFKG
ncbi:RDD family protein [Akkermansiaceae bacterium]|nr:RDD family protein [Akkermansiaceae bacterium]MDB4273002.1 RDD family protein [Akkermansiaceae bacterium]MDB4667458.1 RDD family protein [Akkermansiaceae bacterium]